MVLPLLQPPSELPSYVKPFVLELKEAELRHLPGLPQSEKRKMGEGSLKSFDNCLHNLRHYGEIAFVLAGIKPCVLMAHALWPGFAKGIAEECLRPLMDKYGLEGKGFELHEIRHPMLTSNPVHPGFQWGWVFANRRHADFPLVQRVFLQRSRSPWRSCS